MKSRQLVITIMNRCLLVIPLLVGVNCWASQETKFERSVTQHVTSIGCSDGVATKMISLVSQWKMPNKSNTIVAWEAKLSASAQDKANVAANRLEVCVSIAKMISQTFRPGDPFDLADVLDSKQAQCVGYSQLFWVVANALDIQTTILTVERYSDLERVPKFGHVCCLSSLSPEESVMVDISYGPMAGKSLVSKPFKLQDLYRNTGDLFQLRDESNPLMLHRAFRRLDTQGIISTVLCNKAFILDSQKKYNDALSFYQKAMKISSLDAGELNNMATTLHSLRRNDEALDAIRQSITLRPTYAPAHHNLGNILRDMQKQQEAIAAYEKAVALDDKLKEAWVNLGVCYYVSGADKKAVAALEKAHTLQPTDAQVLLHLGTAYGFVGETRKAQEALRRAIRLNPACSSKARSIQAFLAKQGVKVTLKD
ncbi:tetratricopeptide repeat protein [Planctomycetota bacterium]